MAQALVLQCKPLLANDLDISYARAMRIVIIDMLGGKCVACGFSDERALQIDHVKGGGSQDIKLNGGGRSHYLRVLDSIAKSERKYQLLCANCNWIKRSVARE